MQNYKQEFIQLALQYHVLKFGEFTLKSGRISPYFFNSGLFYTGEALSALGRFYAQIIIESGVSFDGLFGPAYKGIPLVASVAIALSRDYQLNKPYSYNRKEAKAHGESGNIVGAPLEGKLLIIDDVITAGTAVRESIHIIQQNNAEVAGIFLAFDRQERGQTEKSTIQELQDDLKIPVRSIIGFADLAEYIKKDENLSKRLSEYQSQYGMK